MPATVEGTYKARDVEGFLDIYFYRPVGFVLARFFARLGVTPVGVTRWAGSSESWPGIFTTIATCA